MNKQTAYTWAIRAVVLAVAGAVLGVMIGNVWNGISPPTIPQSELDDPTSMYHVEEIPNCRSRDRLPGVHGTILRYDTCMKVPAYLTSEEAQDTTRYEAPANQPIRMLAPNGKVIFIKASSFEDALGQGYQWVPPTADELREKMVKNREALKNRAQATSGEENGRMLICAYYGLFLGVIPAIIAGWFLLLVMLEQISKAARVKPE
jgi:hypothetical protein